MINKKDDKIILKVNKLFNISRNKKMQHGNVVSNKKTIYLYFRICAN